MNGTFQVFRVEASTQLESLKRQQNQRNRLSLEMTRKSPHVQSLGLNSFTLDNSTFPRSRTKRWNQRTFNTNQHLRVKNFLSPPIICHSNNTSRLVNQIPITLENSSTRGLLGGSQSDSSEQIVISNQNREMIVLEFKTILTILETQKPSKISETNLGGFNKINICRDEDTLKSLAIGLTDEAKKNLMRIVWTRRARLTVASANAISILNFANYSFRKLDLSGIFIEEANLRGADLRRAILSGSRMKGVNLLGSCLIFTNLSNCDLREAKLLNFEFLDREYPTITSVSLSGDSRFLAFGSWTKTVKVWDFRFNNKFTTLRGHMSWVTSVSISVSGKFLASASKDRTVKVWSLPNYCELAILRGHCEEVTSVSFSEDDRFLASSSYDSTVKVWDLRTYTMLTSLRSDCREVTSVCFSVNGSFLASTGRNGTVRVWDFRNYHVHKDLSGHSKEVTSLSFAGEELLISASKDTDIKVWDFRTFKELKTLRDHSSVVLSISLSRDGRLLASASGDKSIKIWDLRTISILKTLAGHCDWVKSVSLSADGRLVASASWDNILRIFDLKDYNNFFS